MDCKNHKGIPSTHVTTGNEPLCDECANAAKAFGTKVRKHRGFLWGYPIVAMDNYDEGNDGILDAEIIEG